MHLGRTADRFKTGLDAAQKFLSQAGSPTLVPSVALCEILLTSGAMIDSASITASDPLFDFFPLESGSRALHEVGLSPGQLFLLPVMNWYRFWSGRKIIPQVFHELEFFRRAQIKDRRIGWVHLQSSCDYVQTR